MIFLYILLPIVQFSNNFAQIIDKIKNDNDTILQRKINLECGGIFNKKQIVVESPNYPSNYPPDQDCSFLLQGPDCPTYFVLQFLDFNLEESLGCRKDRLEVGNQDALCKKPPGIKTYFSGNGVLSLKFVSDSEYSGRGFRILATRLPCNSVNPQNDTINDNQNGLPNNHLIPGTNIGDTNTRTDPRNVGDFDPRKVGVTNTGALDPRNVDVNCGNQENHLEKVCCATSYNSKHFYLASPGFPYSNSKPTDCLYHIYRANSNVCRLRIHFLFFWSGEYDPFYGCPRGFLQIDGKLICGCRIGLKIISPFDSHWGSNPKVLRFKNEGYPKSVFSGFALEIIQDECPKKYSPGLTEARIENSSKSFKFYNDQVNRIAWPSLNRENKLEKAFLLNENTEIIDERQLNGMRRNDAASVVKHIYFYKAPDDNFNIVETQNVENKKEPEETTYFDSSSNRGIFPDGSDNFKCRAWGVLQWTLLTQEVLWKQMPTCGTEGSNPVQRDCVELNYVRGYFNSPGYPFFYPANLNVCYRCVALEF